MYRLLTEEEIVRLESQGCRAEDWTRVRVMDGFDPALIRTCTLGGDVRIGNRVMISDVRCRIANYAIGNDVRIEDVGLIETRGKSRFGNGVIVKTVNEAGGREVPIFDGLTAQTAYLIAMYRHRRETIKRLHALIESYAAGRESDMGTIGDGAVIRGCNTILNTHIGPAATLEGVSYLENATIGSTAQAPVRIGYDVKAHHFIVLSGSRIDNGAMLHNCFVGEACKLDHGFTAEHSLFFANCECRNGEAASIFAGPYTVTHHKSTLLIAGIFSFFNAGSGSNQSNHLFKTGAVHQGVHERGTKFGSNAYMMLPAREGPFTVVLGRHLSHHNSEAFPYSYLTEAEGKSILTPGANLRNYGTVRDLGKWPKRDGRGAEPRDLIHFDEHNPFIASRIDRAIDTAQALLSKEDVETYTYERMKIRRTMLRRGAAFYRMAFDASLGAMLSRAADPNDVGSDDRSGTDGWCDLAGMFAPKECIEALLDGIDAGRIDSLDAVERELRSLYARYPAYARQWALGKLAVQLGHTPDDAEIAAAVARGREAAASLKAHTDEDARRDRDRSMSVGYGIDCDCAERIADDYAAVKEKHG